ncbi:hypothetical protein LVY72_11860 [Arthrobacter sp. I2-34]|uniref:Uncharacterized protein n=1 Tax=Arthrobacter hankyongi TaxID=2904801 RepID=A0ABS9L7E5_9MICC|nr:hypothetical protein [Arthrobacter hankyongi]MCG2622606.1 hypothetical protein [Arthrobacter hankyongi]
MGENMEDRSGQKKVTGPCPPQPQGDWKGDPPEPFTHPVSGLRVAAGILAMLTGLWALPSGVLPLTFPDALPGLTVPAALLSISAGIGSLVSGVVMLVTARFRTPGAPVVLLIFSAAALASLSMVALYGPPPGPLPAMAAVILACLALRREQAPGTVMFDGRGGLGIAAGITLLFLAVMGFGDLVLLGYASGGVGLPMVFHLLAGSASLLAGIWLTAGFRRFIRKAPFLATTAAFMSLAAVVLQTVATDLGASGAEIFTVITVTALTLLVIRKNRTVDVSVPNP